MRSRMTVTFGNGAPSFEDVTREDPAEDPTTWITVRPDGSFPHYRYAPYGQETTSEFGSEPRALPAENRRVPVYVCPLQAHKLRTKP
jgi:hypothetical protein